MTAAPTSRIDARFRDLRERNAKGLVVYFTAGDPSLDATGELLAAVERGGADIIELGVPFSDPLADGPVIQRASERALRGGTTLRKILECLPRWRETVRAPIILFSYFNPILRYGLRQFAEDSSRAGADGALVVDLTPEEAEAYVVPSTPRPSRVAVCGAVKLPSEPPPVAVSTRSKPISAASVLACS